MTDRRGRFRVLRAALTALVVGALSVTDLIAPIAAVSAATDPTPVAHWALDEAGGAVAGDSAGSADLAVSDTSWVSDGQSGSALHFDGLTSGADGSAAGLHVASLTVAVWVRGDPNDPPVDGSVIVSLGGRSGCGTPTWEIRVAGEGFDIPHLTQAGPVPIVSSGISRRGIDVWDGAWHHLAVSLPAEPYTYGWVEVDGQLGGAIPGPIALDYSGISTDALALGHAANGCDVEPRYHGDIDDLRIYDQALTQDEIGALLPPIATSTAIVGPAVAIALAPACFDTAVSPSPEQGWVSYLVTSASGPDRLIGPNYLSANPDTLCLSIEGGPHTITAMYSHGLPFAPSTSNTIEWDPARRPTTLTVSGRFQQLTSSPFLVQAEVEDLLNPPETPQGTVDFYETTGGGRLLVGEAVVGYGGYASIALPPRMPGGYSFSADYTGSADAFLPSSGTGDITVYQDSVPGPVVIDGGARYTTDPLVHLDLPTVGARAVYVSNSGGDWKAFEPPEASVDGWDLTDRAFGGQPEDGLKTVHVRMANQFNSTTDDITQSIFLDTSLPVVSSPTVRLPPGSTMSASGPDVVISWSGSDEGSGLAGFDVEQSIDAGPFVMISSRQASSRLVHTLLSGHRYRIRVRGVDRAGNVGPWREVPSTRLSVFQSPPTVSFRGSWRTLRGSGYLLGSDAYATAAGATATLRFKGKSIAWVTRNGSTGGWADVFVDGSRVGRFDLHTSTTHLRRLVFSRTWTTVRTHTITIRVVGTPGHPRVDLDGFIVGT